MTAYLSNWAVREPFVVRRAAADDDIDGFGHVNNLRYAAWAMDAAGAHAEALGAGIDAYRRLGVGCVVQRHEFTYLRPILPGEVALIATWVAGNDGRVRVRRAYEMRRERDGTVCFRGETLFVCVDMKTGRPARMPAQFVEAYAPAAPA